MKIILGSLNVQITLKVLETIQIETGPRPELNTPPVELGNTFKV
jgi:hypothetical protein